MAFIVLGAVTMTAVQYIEVVAGSGGGSTEEEGAVAQLLAEEGEVPCRLEKIDPEWRFPLDMVCKNGTLDVKT